MNKDQPSSLLEKGTFFIYFNICLSIFSRLCFGYSSTEFLVDHLHAIANSQYRKTFEIDIVTRCQIDYIDIRNLTTLNKITSYIRWNYLPMRKISLSYRGASAEYTDFGPPLTIMARNPSSYKYE